MLSKYGLKIKNFSCGVLYEYNLGVREHLSYTNAMFTNSLLSYYLVENGLKVSKDGRTRDIIGINFDFGAKSYAETLKRVEHSIEMEESQNNDPDRLAVLHDLKERVELNKDLYQKKSKEAIDAERSKIFQKLAKELYVAAKSGDPDPTNNAQLRMVIEKAKASNMPKSNIESAIAKAMNKNNSENYEEVRYEGYGPEGYGYF